MKKLTTIKFNHKGTKTQRKIYFHLFSCLCAFVFIFCSAPIAEAAEIPAKAEISTVTVYFDRAMVTRGTSVSLSQGVHKIIVEGLPGALDDSSVRGWGKGTAKVKMLGLTITRKELPQASSAEIERIQQKIESLSDSLLAVSQERSVLENERSYLDMLSQAFVPAFNRGILTGGSAASRLSGVHDIIGRRLAAIADKKNELAQQERKLGEDLEAAQEELDKLRHPGQSETKTLAVDVECLSGGEFNLMFSYIMRSSGWTPIYDIRADSNTGKVEVVSKALVRQQTGEDWNRIELVLSTASPQVGGDMPEPEPLVLDFQYREGGRRNGFALGGMAAPQKRAEAATGAEAPGPMPMVAAQAEMLAGETAIEYKIVNPRTIESDGKPNMVPVGSDTFDGAFSYVAVPKESPYAYLQAKVKNITEHAFMPGNANIFLAGKFVGAAVMPRWGQGEDIDMPLGIDEGISISRKLISKKTDTSLGKTTVSYEWRIEVTNNLARSAPLKIYEPAPQSRHEDIEVKVTLAEPQPSKIEEGGITRWDFNLSPGQKVTINFAYRVKYPASREVENLP